MELEKLKTEIPYKWRVQSFSKHKPQAQCVAYIDARDVMDLLDKHVGAENWQDDYKVVDNKLFAGIGVNTKDIWVWKWDTGVESNIEKEKGQASDAFKRAAVKWGIGRFLYHLHIKYINANEKKTQGNYPCPIDDNGQRIWDVSKYINELGGKSPTTIRTTETKREELKDMGPIKTTIGKVTTKEDISKKGKKYKVYHVLGENDAIYSTMDKSLAQLAKDAMESGLSVFITLKDDEWGNNIEDIELIDG